MLDLWYRALHSRHGIEITCSDAEEVRKKLYKLRRDTQDESLAGISICLSPFDSDKLWLIKKVNK